MSVLRTYGRKFVGLLPQKLRFALSHHSRSLINDTEKFILHGGRDLPVAIEIESNEICNLSCSYCPRPENSKTKLSDEVFKSVMDQLRDWGYRGMVFPHSYNEPLTDKRIYELLSYVNKVLPKSEIRVFSNGVLLNEERMQKLLDCGVSLVRVTIHEGTDEKLPAKIMALSKKYPQIILGDLREETRSMPLSNRGGLLEIGKKNNLPRCYNVQNMVIRSNGNVVLCCNDAKGEHVFGNVNEQSIREIWEEPSYKALRHKINHGNYERQICIDCAYQSS